MAIHNKVFAQNSALIKKEYLRILKSERRMPSQIEVGKNVGLTQTTVSTHLNSIDFNEIVGAYKLFTTDVLNALVDRAIEGDVSAIKFFLFLTAGVREEFRIKNEHIEKVEIDIKVPPEISKRVGDALAKEGDFKIIEDMPQKAIEAGKKAKKKEGRK